MNKETRFFNEKMLEQIKKYKEHESDFGYKILYVIYKDGYNDMISQMRIGANIYEKALTELKDEFKKREKPLTEDEVKKMFPLYTPIEIAKNAFCFDGCDLCKNHTNKYRIGFKEKCFYSYICQNCVEKWRKTNE